MKRLAMTLLIILFVSVAMAQVVDPLGNLRQIHKRIAKQDTDVYINALVNTVKTSAAFKDAAARKLFLDDLNAALGITEFEKKPDAEDLKRIKDSLIAGPWTNESKLAAWAELLKLVPKPTEPEP